jgi:hypothetical protein
MAGIGVGEGVAVGVTCRRVGAGVSVGIGVGVTVGVLVVLGGAVGVWVGMSVGKGALQATRIMHKSGCRQCLSIAALCLLLRLRVGMDLVLRFEPASRQKITGICVSMGLG